MAKLESTINVVGLPQIRELFEIMAKHIDDMPDPVLDAIIALGDDDALVWDSRYIESKSANPSACSVVLDGVEHDRVIELYPFRRQVLTADGLINVKTAEVLNEHGGRVCSWGLPE